MISNSYNCRFLLLLIFILLLSNSVTSQTGPATTNTPQLPSIIPPSPTVANLMLFEEVVVDNHTGQPDINIPLYSKPLDSKLSLDLALKYSTTSGKVESRSGWVGTGWSLDAGGVISRTVRGIPDEKQKVGGPDKSTGVFHLDEYWQYHINSNDSVTNAKKNAFAWKVNGDQNDQYDCEMDLYQFSFLNHSGRFVVVKRFGELVAKLLTKDQKYKIQLVYNNNDYVITSFVVTDANGYRYIFDKNEVTTATAFSLAYDPADSFIPNVAPYVPKSHISAWHLSKIFAPDAPTVALVTFEFIEGVAPLPDARQIETFREAPTETKTTLRMLTQQRFWVNAYNFTQFRNSRSMSYYSSSIVTQKLKRIFFKDSTSLNFSVSQANAHPENNGVYLQKISGLKDIDLVYEEIGSRLWLSQVKIGVGSMALPYKLNYFNRVGLPPYFQTANLLSPSDDWGYKISFHPGVTSFGYNFYDSSAFKTGLLTSIDLPTGGRKEFNYEPHTYSFQGSIPLESNAYYGNPLNLDTAQATARYAASTYSSVLQSGNPIFEVTHKQKIYINTNIQGTSAHAEDFGVSFFKQNSDGLTFAASPSAGTQVNEGLPYVILDKGIYKFKLQYGYLKPDDLQEGTYHSSEDSPEPDTTNPVINAFVNLIFSKLKPQEEQKQWLMGGGVRIQNITFKENPLSLEFERKISYDYSEPNAEISIDEDLLEIPTLPGTPGHPHGDLTLFNVLPSSGGIDGSLGMLTRKYTMTDLRYLFGSADSFPGGLYMYTLLYDVETKGINAQLSKGSFVTYKYVTVSEEGNGFTNLKYLTARDEPSPAHHASYPFTPSPQLDHKRGLLLETSVFNNLGKKLTKTSNSYDFHSDIVAHSYVINEIPNASTPVYSTYHRWNIMSPDRPIMCVGGFGYTPCQIYYSSGLVGPYQLAYSPVVAAHAQLKETTSTEYFYSGIVTDSITSKSLFSYSSWNYQLKSKIDIFKKGSAFNTYETKYQYVGDGFDNSTFSGDEVDDLWTMVDKNIVNAPIVIKTYEDDTLLQTIVTKYSPKGKPLKIALSKGENVPEDKIIYHKYDRHGNPQEVSQAHGSHTVYLWGRNGTAPIAKLENTTFCDVMIAINPLNVECNPIDYSVEEIDNLRVNPLMTNASITTVSYNAEGHITKVKDPRGKKISYHYDNHDRLASISDDNDKVLEAFQYHYRSETDLEVPGITNNQNWILSKKYLEPIDNNVFELIDSDPLATTVRKIQNIKYLDGLGRPIQQVAHKQSTSGKDIITPMAYNALGLQPKEYLPYVRNASLAFDTLAVNNQANFYNTNNQSLTGNPSFETTANPFSEKKFEPSPLKRVLEQAAPGNDWALANGHTIKMDYQANTLADNVLLFKVTTQWNELNQIYDTSLEKIPGGYLPGQLYKTITKDENWVAGTNHTVEEFKDQMGKVILKRTYNESAPHDTYYLYDEYGNLTYVLPPAASQVLNENVPPSLRTYPWTRIAQVDSQLADNYDRLLLNYDNPLICDADLLLEYGGQGGFTVNAANGNVTLNISLTTTKALELRQGILISLEDFGRFPDSELGEITGPDAKYTFLIRENKIEISGSGALSEINASLTNHPLEYSKNYTWNHFMDLTAEEHLAYGQAYDKIKEEELLVTAVPNQYGAKGGISLLIDAEDVVYLNMNISADSTFTFRRGVITHLISERKISDMVLAELTGNGYEYTISIRDNDLVLDGAGILNNINISTVRTAPGDLTPELQNGFCYQYKYDYRNRLVEKKIPGKEWEYIVYDKLDRPVLTQDALLRNGLKWLFTKYDPMGRIAYTGIYTNSKTKDSRKAVQGQVNGHLQVHEPRSLAFMNSGANVSYANEAFPIDYFEVFTINYYDDYDFDFAGCQLLSTITPLYTNIFTANTRTLPTGGKVRTLGTTSWTTSVVAYNEKAWPVFTESRSQYLQTRDLVQTGYEPFLGLVEQTHTTHSRTGVPGSTVIRDYYSYDGNNRPLRHRQRINSQLNEVIAYNKYDELGQLIQKKVGTPYPSVSTSYQNSTSLQAIDYSYNIRGWLKGINNINSADKLFAFKVNYNDPEAGTATTPLYNGNISQTYWRSIQDPVNKRGYGYDYDALNRLTNANYLTPVAFHTMLGTQIEDYFEGNIQYDRNGNILALDRKGLTADKIDYIDQLSYLYFPKSNRLKKVSDAAGKEGFSGKNRTDDPFSYDANGNMITDLNKDITNITYNHLNLPVEITFTKPSPPGQLIIPQYINYVYDATGVKLRKTVTNSNPSSGNVTDYANGYIYEKAGLSTTPSLKFFSHPEGYSSKNPDGTFSYIYQYKDHLGNVRLSYTDSNNNGAIAADEIIEGSDYYPFGLKHTRVNDAVASLGNSTAQKYKYQGQELQDELGLNLYTFKWRSYDPTLGRFISVDPVAENYPHNGVYNFAENRVVESIDFEGKQSWFTQNGQLATGQGKSGPLSAKYRQANNLYSPSEVQQMQAKPKSNPKGPTFSQDKMSASDRKKHNSAVRAEMAQKEAIKQTLDNHANLGSPYTAKSVMQGAAYGAADLATGEIIGKVFQGAKLLLGASKVDETIVVIGEGMGRVKDAKGALLESGAKNVEVFEPTAEAMTEWSALTANGAHLSDEAVQGTMLYQQNVDWIQKASQSGKTILDIGNDGRSMESTFYKMEKQTIYGN